MQLSGEDIADLKRIASDEDSDRYNIIRAFLFRFINNHNESSIKTVVFKPKSDDCAPAAAPQSSLVSVDEDEYLGGPHGNYQNVFAQDYLAFLATQNDDWFNKLPNLDMLGMSKAQLLSKAKCFSDYGMAKARTAGGGRRYPIDQFKFNCLEYCSDYYFKLDRDGALSSNQRDPMGKKRRLAICIARLIELTYTMATFNSQFRTLLEGQEVPSQLERRPHIGTPRTIENLALYLTPRSRRLTSSAKPLGVSQSFSDTVETTINNMLLFYAEIYLDKESHAIYHNLSDNKPELNDPTFLGELPLAFWENKHSLITCISTVLQQLSLFADDKDLDFNSKTSIQYITSKLLELDLHINECRVPFTRIFRKMFPSEFENHRNSQNQAREDRRSTSGITPVNAATAASSTVEASSLRVSAPIPIPSLHAPYSFSIAIPKTPPVSPHASAVPEASPSHLLPLLPPTSPLIPSLREPSNIPLDAVPSSSPRQLPVPTSSLRYQVSPRNASSLTESASAPQPPPSAPPSGTLTSTEIRPPNDRTPSGQDEDGKKEKCSLQ